MHTVSVLGQDKGYMVKYYPLPEEFPEGTPEGKGYIWPYILRGVIMRTLYHFINHLANVYLIIFIDN